MEKIDEYLTNKAAKNNPKFKETGKFVEHMSNNIVLIKSAIILIIIGDIGIWLGLLSYWGILTKIIVMATFYNMFF